MLAGIGMTTDTGSVRLGERQVADAISGRRTSHRPGQDVSELPHVAGPRLRHRAASAARVSGSAQPTRARQTRRADDH
jgi:hypothetical protein